MVSKFLLCNLTGEPISICSSNPDTCVRLISCCWINAFCVSYVEMVIPSQLWLNEILHKMHLNLIRINNYTVDQDGQSLISRWCFLILYFP